MITCELCTENFVVHAVSKCNHNNICFLCIIKLRVKTNNERCPFCNLPSSQVVLTDKPDINYEDIDLKSTIEYTNGIYFENQKVKDQVDEYNQIKCPIHKCNDTTVHHNMSNLKKHLKEKHNRYFCNICLDHRTLVFKEQRLFTRAQLDKHMKKGDLDEEGNVIFFHPYCKYDDRYFYDEEALIKHLRECHYKCDLCDQDRKFIYYKAYGNLEIHYNLSHYLCQDEICRKSHTVFKTLMELEQHALKYHGNRSTMPGKGGMNVNQNLMMSMTNFNYGNATNIQKTQPTNVIKDKEGTDFEPEILSQRKFRTHFHTETEVSGDERLDIRRYFPRNHHKDLHIPHPEHYIKESKDEEHKGDPSEEGGGGSKGGKSKKGGKGGKGKEESVYVPKHPAPQQDIMLEQCNMASYIHLAMSRDELLQELSKVLSETERNTLKARMTDYYKGKINESVLFDSWLGIVGKNLTFKVFPFFIATCEDEGKCVKLDTFFYQQMLKLPRKHEALIYELITYNDFFKSLYNEVEKNVIARIKAKNIDFEAKYFMMDPSRIFQLIQIIKRLPNPDMATFKFAINFGLNPKTKEAVADILLHDKTHIQEKLDAIPEHEIFILLEYLDLCKAKLAKNIENISLSKISRNLLEDIFKASPEVAEYFKKQLGKEAFQLLIEKKYVGMDHKPANQAQDFPKLVKPIEERKKEENKWEPKKKIDAKNTQDFPDLKKHNIAKETPPLAATTKPKVKKILENGDGWEVKKAPLGYTAQEPQVKKPEVKKKVEQDFPTLGGNASTGEQASYWGKLMEPVPKKVMESVSKDKDTHNEDLNEGEEETIEDMMIGVTEKKGKKNKGKKTLYLAGGFK